MVPRDRFERITNANLVAGSLREMGVESVRTTDRYDVCVGDQKVSGSAFRITNQRAYHHGTMLINSNLDLLRGALRPTPNLNIIDSKAVSSVRSPVTRLVQSLTTTINHDRFTHFISKAFMRHYYRSSFESSNSISHLPNMVDDSEVERNEVVRTGYQELKSWDWIFGQTPQFTRSVDLEVEVDGDRLTVPIELTYKHGKIERVMVDSTGWGHRSDDVRSMVITEQIERTFRAGDPIDF